MCGRYTLFTTDELEDRYRVDVSDAIRENYNVAPSQTMPVVTNEGLKMMRWGLIPPWSKDEKIGYKLINARSETIFEKPIWKKPIMQRRCLIPANGFYEWKKLDESKQPYYIHLKKMQIFSFAGVWEMWKHDGKEWHTFSILTTTPNKEMSLIHDRMPVILHENDESQWLTADNQNDISVLLQPYANNELDTVKVSTSVNAVSRNEPSLIQQTY